MSLSSDSNQSINRVSLLGRDKVANGNIMLVTIESRWGFWILRSFGQPTEDSFTSRNSLKIVVHKRYKEQRSSNQSLIKSEYDRRNSRIRL